jgi:hypothetical protein
MKFRLLYEIDIDTKHYSIKVDDDGMTDEETFGECVRALQVIESHIFHNKPSPTGVH